MMQFWPCYCFHIWICFQSVVYLIFASGIALMFVNCDASSPKLQRSWCQQPCRVDTAVADTSAIANLSNKLLFSSRKISFTIASLVSYTFFQLIDLLCHLHLSFVSLISLSLAISHCRTFSSFSFSLFYFNPHFIPFASPFPQFSPLLILLFLLPSDISFLLFLLASLIFLLYQ